MRCSNVSDRATVTPANSTSSSVRASLLRGTRSKRVPCVGPRALGVLHDELQESGGTGDVRVLDVARSRAECLGALGDFEQAEDLLTELIDFVTDVLGPDDQRTLRARITLAAVKRDRRMAGGR